MSLEFKENLCPNVLTTEADEDGILSNIKLIKRTYSESVVQFQTSTNHSKSIKQLNPILSALFKCIAEKHERNRQQMNDLIKQFTQRYEQIRQVTIHWDDSSLNEESHTEHNQFLESILERLEGVSSEQLQSLASLRLAPLANELVALTGVTLQELWEFIELEGITQGRQLIGVVSTGNLAFMRDEEEQHSGLGSFLVSEVGELAVAVIIDKLQTRKEDFSQEELLSERELRVLTELLRGRKLEEEVEADPTVLLRLLSEYQMNAEMQQAERQVLEASYRQIRERISDYISSKQNYAQLVQKSFQQQDPMGSGLINYQSFCRAFQKLQLLNTAQITTLFRYCIMLQLGTFVEMIDRTQKISYFSLLSELLCTKALVFDRQHQMLEQLRMQNKHLERRIAQADRLINSLAEEKEELLVHVMECQQRVLAIQQQKTRVEAEGISEVENLKRQFHNEQTVTRVKAESEIRRLNNIVENQNRVMEAYRIQLENIMNQVQERHR